MNKTIISIFLILLFNFNAYSDQTDPRLERLFENLIETKSELKAKPILAKIWSIWSLSGDKKIQKKFNLGNQFMEQRKFSESINIFSDIINSQPNFAEVWNKRATVYYITGNYEKSINDIFTTLELEPRHFGALDGLAQIYFTQDKFYEAAQTYRKILEILPFNNKAQIRLEYLEQSFI
jgi:tetratricopeptide (TPR) repeat protein